MKNFTRSFLKMAAVAIVTLLPALASAESVQCSETFVPSKFSMTEVSFNGNTYVDLSWENLDSYGITSTPNIPAKYVSYALPYNAKNVSISDISYNVASERVIAHKVMPTQEPRPSNGSVVDFTTPDVKAYAKVGYNTSAKLLTVQNGFDINQVAVVAVMPVIYSPGENRVKVLDKVSFTINYEVSQAAKSVSYAEHSPELVASDVEFLKMSVKNPESVNESALKLIADHKRNNSPSKARKYVGDGLPAYEYCIVTSAELAPAFERMVALKRMQGFDAGIVLIEDILKDSHFSQGDRISNIKDDAGCLRQYLKESWATTRYALLGGKPPIVPIRYGTGGNYSSLQQLKNSHKKDWQEYIIPSDYYFAEFENNWNSDGDELYGELKSGFQHGARKIFVGRLLCTTVEQVNNYIDKLEFYEMNPGNGDTSYLSNSYVYFSKEAAEEYSNKNATANEIHALTETNVIPWIREMHPSIDTKYQGESKTHGAEVTSDLIASDYHFWDLHSHGSPEGVNLNENQWPYFGVNALDNEPGAFQQESINGLDNINNFGKPYYTYSMSCGLIPFDSPKYKGYGAFSDLYDSLSLNFGESFTLGKNYGGVAFLGNTRFGYFHYSAYLEQRFFSYLNLPSVSSYEIGRSDNYSKTSSGSPILAGDTWYNHYLQLSHNILGDPQLRIWNANYFQSGRKFNSYRRKNSILIQCTNAPSNEALNGRTAIIEEPDGTIHKRSFITDVTFDNISVNSKCSVYGYSVPTTPLNYILQNITISKKDYVYCSTAIMGSHLMRYNTYGDVIFENGANVTIDATDDVSLKIGTIIKNGATLKVITPKNCSLEGVVIEDGGKLEIFAGTATGNSELQERYNKSKLIAQKYNKYGVLEDGNLTITFHSSLKTARKESDYTPMFEIGKTWNYKVENRSMIYPDPDRFMSVRIDETKVIDNKEYFVANAYYADEPDVAPIPYAYFREDIDNRQVYCMLPETDSYQFLSHIHYKGFMPEIGSEYLLYDFGENPSLADITFASEDFKLTYKGRTFNGFLSGIWGHHAAILQEVGVVLLELDKDKFLPKANVPYNLLGVLDKVSGPMGFVPLLCSVVAADGTVLLSIPENENGRISEVRDDEAALKIEVKANSIEISGAYGSHVSLTDMQGIEVFSAVMESHGISIPTTGMQHGIYVLKVGDSVRKIII